MCVCVFPSVSIVTGKLYAKIESFCRAQLKLRFSIAYPEKFANTCCTRLENEWKTFLQSFNIFLLTFRSILMLNWPNRPRISIKTNHKTRQKRNVVSLLCFQLKSAHTHTQAHSHTPIRGRHNPHNKMKSLLLSVESREAQVYSTLMVMCKVFLYTHTLAVHTTMQAPARMQYKNLHNICICIRPKCVYKTFVSRSTKCRCGTSQGRIQ